MMQAPTSVEPDASRRAHRLVLACLALVLVSIGVGGSWDRAWHTREPFDDFFSPPHLFIYATVAAAMCIFAFLLSDRRAVAAFGPPVPILSTRSLPPGPVSLLGAGLAGIGAAGLLDAVWHTRYGLDETNFSAPHKLLGVSIFFVALGYISCRLALDTPGRRPRSDSLWLGAMGFLVLAGSSNPIVGPFEQRSQEALAAILRIPVLAADANVRHTFRIYGHWNITRTNPLLPLLITLWLVAALTFLSKLARRPEIVLAVGGVFALFSFMSDNRTSRALRLADDVAPIGLAVAITAAVFVGARRISHSDIFVWSVTGLAAGAASFVLWGRHGDAGLALAFTALTPILGAVAGWFGRLAYDAVSAPTGIRIVGLVAALLIVLPSATGSIDLWLRAVTP